MLRKLFHLLPDWARKPARLAKKLAVPFLYHGTNRYCPVCEKSSRKFVPFGLEQREDAQCLRCGSLERHRLVWTYFQHSTDLFDETTKGMLHVAPEECLEPRLAERLGNGYITADLLDPNVMVKMDITDIKYPDDHFDVVYCSHVLEHVPDDRKAMREFYRVLKPGGWAILLVPITAEKTYEDASIVDPSERLEAFGQEDHVRRYGPDYVDRLREAGFTVTVATAGGMFDADEIVRFGLGPYAGEIFYFTK